MHQPSGATQGPLEVWAGFECTLNRVGNTQHDQLARSGHYARTDDIARIAALGVRTVRYPVLWERIERREPRGRPWEWTDQTMGALRASGIDAIVGLMHHGSGPLDTGLLHEDFPERFAAYAGCVAARYPWITRYTPINEPLTTARFSTLYGLWYPHARDDTLFLRATLNQTRATRLAMAAIRRIRPDAQLVQTEDLGRTHSTVALAGQAAFENERRWLSLDLLTGRVTRAHPLWSYLQACGISGHEIARAVGDGCPPTILGLNHYATSERWLDERLDRYPAHTHGGNHQLRYADVEAVRARPDGVAGPAALLMEAWQRYGIPLAVTEAHLGCTREQQMRWLLGAWTAAHAARGAGADVRAVTAWAILGAHGWSSLATQFSDDYEPGLFDIRAASPRATGLAALVQELATSGVGTHPVLAEPGWWEQPARLQYRVDGAAAQQLPRRPNAASSPSRRIRPILIAGGDGTLGSAFARICENRGLNHVALVRAQLDIADADQVRDVLADSGAWAVVNAAGFVRVDDAERHAEECHRSNVTGSVTLARACAERGVSLATFSSDLVFGGNTGVPYVEDDAVAPLSTYGASKAEGERRVLALAPHAMVVRTAWFFGPWDEWNFLTRSLRTIAAGRSVDLADDLVVSPTYVPHLVNTVLDLVIDGERGLWHLTNRGSATAAALVRRAARAAGLDASLVRGRSWRDLPFVARRPGCATLGSKRGTIMPLLDQALSEYLDARGWERPDVAESCPVECTVPAGSSGADWLTH